MEPEQPPQSYRPSIRRSPNRNSREHRAEKNSSPIPVPPPRTPYRAPQQIPVSWGSANINSAARVRGRTPRKARQAGFRILPLPQTSGISALPVPPLAVAQAKQAPNANAGRAVMDVSNQQLIADATPRGMQSVATLVPPTTCDPTATPESLVLTATALQSTRELKQRDRERGRTPRKAQTAKFQVQPPTNPFKELPEQSQPEQVTITDAANDSQELTLSVAAPEKSASQSAATLQDIFERMRRSRERGNIPTTQYVSRLPVAQWRTGRASLAAEKSLVIAPPALDLAFIVASPAPSIPAPALPVPSINQPVLPVASSVTTPKTAAWARKDQRLYRERGTPRKARNTPFVIKPLGFTGDIPTPVVFEKSKLGGTNTVESSQVGGGC